MVATLDNVRCYLVLESRVAASIGSPYMDKVLFDLITEAHRVQAADCDSVACAESEARAELCLHSRWGTCD